MPKNMVMYYNQIDIGIFLCFLKLGLNKNNIGFEKEVFIEEDYEKSKNLTEVYKI